MFVNINAQFDSSLIRPSGSDRYLLFKVNGKGDERVVRAPLNMSLIIDRSGSMSSENKLELVKKAAAFVIERLTEQDRFSVVAYDDEVRVITKSVKATAKNRAEAKNAIASLHTGGSTNLSGGWLSGCHEISEFQSESRYIDCAWLLTDGLANVGIVDQEELTKHARELKQRGISTTTFGVGLDFNEDLLRALAEKGGGNFYFIDSSKQIQNYFEGELGERLRTVGRNLALQLDLPAGITLDCLNDYEVTKSHNRAILHLGDVYAGEEKLVMVKLTLPKDKIGTQLQLNALLMYTEAVSGAGREIRVSDSLTLTYTSDEECDRQVISAEFKELIGKMLGARAKQEVLKANREGNYTAVAPIMASFNQALAGAGVADSDAVKKEAEEVEKLGEQAAAAPMAPAATKAAFYSSHNQQRSRKDYKKE